MSFQGRKNSLPHPLSGNPESKKTPLSRPLGPFPSDPNGLPFSLHSHLTRFLEPKIPVRLTSYDTATSVHTEAIIKYTLAQETEFLLPLPSPSTLQLYREFFSVFLDMLFSVHSVLKMESLFMAAHLFFLHNSRRLLDHSHVDTELFIVYAFIANKFLEYQPFPLVDIVEIALKEATGSFQPLQPEVVRAVMRRVEEKEGAVLADIGFDVRDPPFFFFLDFLLAAEGHPKRSSGIYDRELAQLLFREPQRVFCRPHGLVRSVVEVLEAVQGTSKSPPF